MPQLRSSGALHSGVPLSPPIPSSEYSPIGACYLYPTTANGSTSHPMSFNFSTRPRGLEILRQFHLTSPPKTARFTPPETSLEGDRNHTGKTAQAWAHQVSVYADHSASRLPSLGEDLISGTGGSNCRYHLGSYHLNIPPKSDGIPARSSDGVRPASKTISPTSLYPWLVTRSSTFIPPKWRARRSQLTTWCSRMCLANRQSRNYHHTGLGIMPFTHCLPRGRVYPLFIPELKTMKDYIKEALKQQLINPSTSLAASSFFFMGKMYGGLRPCIDHQTLNDHTVMLPYSLPLVPAALEELRGGRIFSKLDLRCAYILVRIREGDEWKMIFITPSGHYEYWVMSYGLSNSPVRLPGVYERGVP